MAETRFKLNTSAEIPALGFGTWQSPAGEVQKAVKYALSVGYKHVDGGTTFSLCDYNLLICSSILLC
jgi:diketogulonate reductase-like aldo/keto reductase